MEHNQINNDTICALSTPAGTGGIAVIRISGPEAITITDSLWRGKKLCHATSHTAHLGWIVDPDNGPLDQCIATIYRAPRSFTADDVVELSIHASQWVQQEAIALLLRSGCRLAEPGEFTRRAFIAGNIDLAQAEAIADVIASQSRAAHRIALSQMRGDFSRQLATMRDSLLNLASLLELELDFAEEDVQFASRTQLITQATQLSLQIKKLTATFATGQAIRNGIPTAIIGNPNAGKSTLLNLLTGDNRAIVSDIPGTTRDTIEELITLNGIQFRIIDTAGLRHTTDTIEQLGIQRTIDTLHRAQIIIWLIDATNPGDLHNTIQQILTAATPNATILPVINKTDLITPQQLQQLNDELTPTLPTGTAPTHTLSAHTLQGFDQLTATLPTLIDTNHSNDQFIITNARHYQALLQADTNLTRFIQALNNGTPTDLAAQDLRQALHHLGTITGTITTPDILSNIFSRFCVGK